MPVLNINTEKETILGIWKVEESVLQLENLLPHLIDTDAYKKLNHDLRRLEWLAARALMREMNLSKELSYTEHGKPFYEDGPKISITHSKEYVAILINPLREVGIDIQEIVPKVEKIKHKYCNDHELEWASSIKDFTLIWSAKEAVFKVKEKNVLFKEDIQVSSPTNNQTKVVFRGEQQFTGHLMKLKGYCGVYVVE